MRILFIGDIVGSGGRRMLRQDLAELKRQHQIDMCLANVENAAAGMGLTAALAQEIREAGVDLMTLGNHSWARQELLDTIDRIPGLVRPINGPSSWPGRGHLLYNHPLGQVLLINLLGRVFMDPVDDPFAAVDRVLEEVPDSAQNRIVIVDFHAEATSEKNAMAWYLDGRATLVAGTHTHVQTADERILDQGTAFITDVGMTGPVNGVIGMDKATSLRRFVDHLPTRYQMAQGPSALCAVVVDADEKTGRARRIERIRIEE
ncbi:MAG: TIGR00282 family metallophosphoesterase [Clostridiaceae bacterium]|nr:TIGR00282 family metallophosphoesterase [Clostridiales bacterium]MDD2441170.1 TIGR00282 family metallophosphoesterase [Eubacteriales bacterium]MDD4138657.1 TIGR00282 family metallophosphoesterase [Eubacteriales bacterium]MDD4743245.1 TIGR00282 family metallophosphoesterase [Eubacteriales bacterium]NLB43550.1 TIGR00282 family metallophosphoesterase [Clostridiaceae bacterium]